MVHVMSEVKRVNIDFSGLQGPAKCGQCGSTTTDICNQNGCGFLESGNGESELDAQRLRADTAEAELEVLKREVECRISNEVNAVEALAAAEQRIAELTKSFEKFRDVVRGCERLASKYSPCIDAVDEEGGDDPTHAIFHRLYYAMFDADAALNPNPEAESQ